MDSELLVFLPLLLVALKVSIMWGTGSVLFAAARLLNTLARRLK